jgi:hypothetical protein
MDSIKCFKASDNYLIGESREKWRCIDIQVVLQSGIDGICGRYYQAFNIDCI